MVFLFLGVSIGAIAGIIGGFVRESLSPYGELSIGFRDVFFLFCPFYWLFAGMVSALIAYFLLGFIGKYRQVPTAAKLFLCAIIGFIGGFLIFTGLVIHGAATLPYTTGASAVDIVFSPVRLGLLVAGFALSLIIGIALLNLLDRLTPKIEFRGINIEPIAVGLYVFGYMLFFGLILNAALTTPL